MASKKIEKLKEKKKKKKILFTRLRAEQLAETWAVNYDPQTGEWKGGYIKRMKDSREAVEKTI